MKESKRRLTVVKKTVTRNRVEETITWTPYLPNNMKEGIKHHLDTFREETSYIITQYQNDMKHGLQINYYVSHIHVSAFVNDQRHGIEHYTNYNGNVISSFIWSNGEFVIMG